MANPTFADLVAQRTGLTPSEVAAWVQAEGGPPDNPLNIGPGQHFGTPQGAANATANLLTRGPSWAGYNQIIKAAKTGNSAAVESAIKASHWDATHYSNGVLDRTFGAAGLGSGAGPAGAQQPAQRLVGATAGLLQPGFTPQSILARSLLSAAGGGGKLDPSTFLGALTQARQAQLSMGNLSSSVPASNGSLPVSSMTASSDIKFSGDTTGINPNLLQSVSAAVKSIGGTEIVVTSGKRSPGPSNDVPNSNHITGNALDGYAVINGQHIPIGTALLHVASKFGLRSGDVAGFDPKTSGGFDPIHIDDGYNVRGQ